MKDIYKDGEIKTVTYDLQRAIKDGHFFDVTDIVKGKRRFLDDFMKEGGRLAVSTAFLDMLKDKNGLGDVEGAPAELQVLYEDTFDLLALEDQQEIDSTMQGKTMQMRMCPKLKITPGTEINYFLDGIWDSNKGDAVFYLTACLESDLA